MSDGVVLITLIAGFGFILVAGDRLGAGSHHSFSGLFPSRGVADWPTGVQEGDAPRFQVRHLDHLRPGQPVVVSTSVVPDSFDGPRAELLDLGTRHLDTQHA